MILSRIITSIQATATWAGKPVVGLKKKDFQAALEAGVHNIEMDEIKALGTWSEVRNAAASQEEYSVDTTAKVYIQSLQLRKLRKEKKELAERFGSLATAVSLLDEDSWKHEGGRAYKPFKSQKKRTAAAVALLSDLHIEETVDADMVEGVNSFNLAEAEARLERLFQGIAYVTDHHRTSFHIDTLILWLGGDLVSGFIHDDLVEMNELSPTHATFWMADKAEEGINFLLEHGDFEKIVVPFSFGNHGRTHGVKTPIQTIAHHSFEWLIAQHLQRVFRDDDRVEIVIPTGELTYVDVWDYTLRFTHGHQVRGGMGTYGPITGAVSKISAWNTVRHADITHIGHWHRYADLPNLVINGSLIGYGAYAQSIGAPYEEPAQAFYLLDESRGKCHSTPLWVAEKAGEPTDKGDTPRILPQPKPRKKASKLTDEDVAEIRASKDSQRVLAKRYKVSQPHICRIKTGQSW